MGDSRRKRTGVEHGVGSGEASAQAWLPQRCGAGVRAGGSQSGGWGQQGSQSEFIFGGRLPKVIPKFLQSDTGHRN
jgi:hypothetical protein